MKKRKGAVIRQEISTNVGNLEVEGKCTEESLERAAIEGAFARNGGCEGDTGEN